MASTSSKLKSRKLMAGIFGAISPILTQAITGAVGWPVAAGLSAMAVVTYLLSQGAVDAMAARQVSTTKAPPDVH